MQLQETKLDLVKNIISVKEGIIKRLDQKDIHIKNPSL